MKQITNNTSWFTLLVILWVIWFLLILLTWIFKVVLLELADTKNMDFYFKAQSASEAWEEIAMLKLKEKKFWYDGEESYDQDGASVLLSRELNNSTRPYHENKDVFFGYDIDSKTTTYTWELAPSKFHVIPLFHTDDSTVDGSVKGNTKAPFLDVSSWNQENFVWNLIWETSGVSGTWSFDPYQTVVKEKVLSAGDRHGKGFSLNTTFIHNFLMPYDKNYLTVLNTGTVPMKYAVRTADGESFTKPITTIYSSAKIGEMKQNIKLEIDNSKYFDVLKYTIYNSQ